MCDARAVQHDAAGIVRRNADDLEQGLTIPRERLNVVALDRDIRRSTLCETDADSAKLQLAAPIRADAITIHALDTTILGQNRGAITNRTHRIGATG